MSFSDLPEAHKLQKVILKWYYFLTFEFYFKTQEADRYGNYDDDSPALSSFFQFYFPLCGLFFLLFFFH